MRISRSSPVPVDVETAFAVIATEVFQRDKVAEVCTSASATLREQGEVLRVDGERVLPTAGMPRAVVAAAGDELRITEQQIWSAPDTDGARHAELEMTVQGLPLSMTGRASLTPDGEGSVLTFDGDLTCGLPLVGGRIERAAAPVIEGAFDDEATLLARRTR